MAYDVFIDLDGVIADDRHRTHFALEARAARTSSERSQLWDQYFARKNMIRDRVWPEGRLLITEMFMRGNFVHYLTGRREDTRATTMEWFERNDLPTCPLFMRPIGVHKPLANLKTEFLEQWRDTRADLPLNKRRAVLLFDDDPEVIRLAQERLGSGAAMLTPWHVKVKALVKEAQA